MKTEKVGSGGSIYNYYYSLSSPSEALNVTLRAPDGDDKEYVAEGVILMFFPVNFDSCSAPVWQNSQGAQSSMFQLLILGVQCILIYSIV